MYAVSEEFKQKIKSADRKVIGKVQIDYTDPFIDQSIDMAASEQASTSYLKHTADMLQTPVSKILSLDGSCKPDGSYRPAPSEKYADTHQMGWWGKQLSNASSLFIQPYPRLTVSFFSRPITRLKVAGDSKRGEYPVNFAVGLYDINNTLLYEEVVINNALIDWNKTLSNAVTQVTSMVLTITKWSHPNRQVKILEFYTSIQEIYEGEDLIEIKLLEEREVDSGSLPVGSISANEIEVRLNNEDRRFDAGNKNSQLYETLKVNRRIKAWLGIEKDDLTKEYVPLGIFWSGDWDVPEEDTYAHTLGRDRLDMLRKTTYSTSEVQAIKDYGDISTGKESKMLASSMYSSAYSPDNLVDGIITFGGGSAFATGNGVPLPQWHQIDLGDLFYIDRVKWISNRTPAQLPKDYIIEISLTGEFNGEQIKVAEKTGNSVYLDWVEHNFDRVLGRYARMTVLTISSGNYYELSEWQIFGGNPISLYTLTEQILIDAGLKSDEYWIDPELQQFLVPYSYFEPQPHREALRKIAEACVGQVYCDRLGIIRVEGPNYLKDKNTIVDTLTPMDYFKKNNPVKWSQIANYIEVETNPLRPDIIKEVYKSNDPISITLGQRKTITVYYNQTPCIDANVAIVGSANLTKATYYAWGADIEVEGTANGTFTIVVNAKPMIVINKDRVVVKDEISIVDNGEIKFTFPNNPLVQTRQVAETIASILIEYYKDPRRDTTIDAWGNPAWLLGDKLKVTDANEENQYHITKQEIDFDGGLRVNISGRRG